MQVPGCWGQSLRSYEGRLVDSVVFFPLIFLIPGTLAWPCTDLANTVIAILSSFV